MIKGDKESDIVEDAVAEALRLQQQKFANGVTQVIEPKYENWNTTINFSVFSMLELKAEMDGLMYRTKDQLRVSNDDHVMSILRHYKWNTNDIMNAFATPQMIQ